MGSPSLHPTYSNFHDLRQIGREKEGLISFVKEALSMSNVNSLGKGRADACFVVESSFMSEGNSGVPICMFDRKSKQNIKLRFIDLLNSVTY